MKILLMSDTHLGFGAGREREDDCFLTFREGITEGMDSDAILMAGDVFDTRTPSNETFAKAMETLLMAKSGDGARILGPIDKDLQNEVRGIPVIAIHGNHERRVKGLVNPVEALERGGFLVHLHCNGIILRKKNSLPTSTSEAETELVAIQGMSAVPGQYAEAALKEWNPKPLKNCYNILMIHQNLEGFLFTEEPLPKESLPPGFDLYICGDIHDQAKAEIHGKPLILPGSTISTQVRKESALPRSFCRIDTASGSIETIPFRDQRKILYGEFQEPGKAEEFVRACIQENSEVQFKPIIKLRTSFNPEELKKRFPGIIASQNLSDADARSGISPVSAEERLNIATLSGKKILEKNLQEAGLDRPTFEGVFDLLLEKRHEDALNILRKKEKVKDAPGGEGNREGGEGGKAIPQPEGIGNT